MEEKNIQNQLNPSAYFEQVKEKRNKVTDKDLCSYYDGLLTLIAKAQKTGQTKAIRQLVFQADCVEKERELVKAGIDTFVYADDITDYIKNVAKKVVKVIELENYPREIPDEIVEVIEKVGPLFDQLYVVFTDYTGEVERQVQREQRERDPILFGSFQKEGKAPGTSVLNERFYFLGDWVDPWCDLTLSKMVTEMGRAGKSGITHHVSTPVDLDAIRAELAKLEEQADNGMFRINENRKPAEKPFFERVKTFFRKD